MHTGSTAEYCPPSGGLPEWAGQQLRLDPYRLPHQLAFERAKAAYAIDRHGVVMKRQLTCGLPVTIALPSRSFIGIAARAVENLQGMTVTLELHHRDPQLSVPLLVANDLDDIAADWHAWSRLMHLPMLIVGAQGEATPVQRQLGDIMIEPVIQRRKRFGSLKRRPWFLRRRKPGVIGPVVRISGEELIARD
jgi:hypothetical protein